MSHPVLEFTEITPFITIGTNMCCNLHADALAESNFTADIDLEATRQELPPQMQLYLWLPTPDNTPPALDQLLVGVRAIHQLVQLKRKIYVHCQNGHGRSPTLVIAYFIATGLAFKEAYQRVQSRRPEIHLHKSQESALREFEQRYGGSL